MIQSHDLSAMTQIASALFLALCLAVPVASLAQNGALESGTLENETLESEAEEVEKEARGVYCNLSSQDLRERLGDVRAAFLSAIVAVDELETGYRYWFEKSHDQLVGLAEFVHFESECCAFMNFEISLAKEANRVALSITGQDGTKDTLEALADAASFDLQAAVKARR